MPKSLFQLFFSIHQLSIDVALGAAAVLFGLSTALRIHIPWYFYVLLINGTFLIYWVDHIQDSKQTVLVQAGSRHAIFKVYRRVFFIAIACLVLGNALLVYLFLSIQNILLGSVLLLVLLAYLRFHRTLKRIIALEKEILIAFLYTCCTGFAACIVFTSSFVSDWLVFAFLLLSVFCSCIQNVFSTARIESQQDAQWGIRNISHLLGATRIKVLQELLLCLQALICITFLVLFPHLSLLVFSLLLLMVATINYALPYFYVQAIHPSYRWLGDGAFLLLFLCGL